MATVDPRDVPSPDLRSVVGTIGGVIVQAVNVVLDMESAPTSTAAAPVTPASRVGRTASTRALLALLRQVNDLLRQFVDDGDDPDGLWSSTAAAHLAGIAVRDGGTGRPASVRTVLGYLTVAGLCDTDRCAPPRRVREFAHWLDTSAENQADLGLIGVYTGAARGLSDVPGGVRDGDLVIVDGVGTTVLGIVGNVDQLYNNGPVRPDFGAVATLRVYRPMCHPGR